MSHAIRWTGLVLLGLIGVLALRAFTLPSLQPSVPGIAPVAVDAEGAAARLAEAVRFETVSRQDPALAQSEAFDAFQRWLTERYPALHARLERERTPEGSLVFTWRGSEAALEPMLLLAHQDVVPAVEGADRWTHPPFSGVLADGFVWGRGTIDDKSPLIALCEAVERLLREGFQPRRTVILAFGHDEEIGGDHGAVRIAARLAERSVHPQLVLDEGFGIVGSGLVPGLTAPLAGIGIAEKGYVTLELRATVPGGHSSTPASETAIGVLARAIRALEERQMPARIGDVTGAFFDHIAPEASFPLRLVLGNRWLFGPLLVPALGRSAATNALIRTTTAPTMLAAGEKENVIAPLARAWINFRVLPGDRVDDVKRHAEAVIGDSRVAVVASESAREPSPVSPIDGDAYALIRQTIREVFPDAVVAPALVLGGTDARHYGELTPNVYRFVPFRFGPTDLTRIHGIDERIAIDSFADGIRFYVRLLQSGAGSASP